MGIYRRRKGSYMVDVEARKVVWTPGRRDDADEGA
jgi:hypothetical protein